MTSGLLPPSSKKKKRFPVFFSLSFFFKSQQSMGSQTSKKKWRAWFTEGCNWRWVNRWKEPSSLFLKWLCHAYYPTTLPPPKKKIRLKKKSKKKSVIVRIRSLCCMRYGWIKAGYLGQGVLFIYLFFLSLNRRKRTGCVRVREGGGRIGMLFPAGLFPVPLVVQPDQVPLMDNFFSWPSLHPFPTN